jgi:signal transduction histidine kinase
MLVVMQASSDLEVSCMTPEIELTNKERRDSVLVVDDEPANLQLMSQILEEEGYEVRAAPSGKFALELAERFRPDLILLDVRMPKMDGYEVCRRLKTFEKSCEVPVIFVSAYSDAEDEVAGFEAGGTDYVAKPVRPAELLARVSTHLSLSRMHRELGEKNRQLKESNAKLQELAKLKSIFIATVSHELRSPIHTILGYAETLHDGLVGELTPDQRSFMKNIYVAAEHLLALIDDIIDVSALEGGTIKPERSRFILADLIDDSVLSITTRAREKGLVVTRSGNERVEMYADRRRLRQCLVNLLDNAVKYTPQGSIEIHTAGDDDSISLTVCDSGIGIAPDEIDRVFNPFERLPSGVQKDATGTGLGLYLTRKLVDEVLDGELSVESSEGEGTIFGIHLPVVKVEEENEEEDIFAE